MSDDTASARAHIITPQTRAKRDETPASLIQRLQAQSHEPQHHPRLWTSDQLEELSALLIKSSQLSQTRRQNPWLGSLSQTQGLRVRCTGETQVVLKLISRLLTSYDLTISAPQTHQGDSSCAWLKLTLSDGLRLDTLKSEMSDHLFSNIRYDLYEPLGSRGQIWRALACDWVLRPDVDVELLDWIESRLSRRDLIISNALIPAPPSALLLLLPSSFLPSS